jgi:adenylyltransferase/sulfurtransferase
MLKQLGFKGQLKLKQSKVCIAGLGGLGSPIARRLTAMGIGYIRLADRDIIERSNLQRQYLYDTDTLGYSKAEIAAKRLNSLNPHIIHDPMTVSINDNTAIEVIRDMDVVVDGLDAVKPRYALNNAAIKLGIPYIFAGAIMTHGNVSTIIPGKTPCLECFYSKMDDDSIQKCATVGVHPSILGIIASIEVSETIRLLLEQEPLLKGKLLFANLDDLTIDLIKVIRRKDCPVCGKHITPQFETSKREITKELCAREGNRSFILVPKDNLNLPLSKLSNSLQKKGWSIDVEGELAITATIMIEKKISIMKSGVMIAKGIETKKEVIRMYRNLVTEELKIDWSQIE